MHPSTVNYPVRGDALLSHPFSGGVLGTTPIVGNFQLFYCLRSLTY